MIGWALLGGLLVAAAAPALREFLRAPVDEKLRRTAPGEFERLSRGETHFRWQGPLRGPVAVCVHGLTTPSMVWDGLARHLVNDGYRVLIYDLYGRGFSDRPKGAQTVGFFVTQLEELLDSQGVSEEITVIGYSMGGVIGTAFAARHPEAIRRLVLLAPAGMGLSLPTPLRFTIGVPLLGDWLFHMLYPSAFRAAIAAEGEASPGVAEVLEGQRVQLDRRGFVAAVLSSLRGALRAPMAPDHRALYVSGVPVVAVWGREDRTIPLSAIGVLSQWNRTARQEVIESAGHGLPYTHADELAAILRPVLTGQ